MLSIIKTAIVTITLSFISGVLLDHYKNIAPRIICKIGKGRKVRLNEKEMRMYNLVIKNSSKQTIHNLNVNLHAYENEVEIRDTEITRGLKFNVSNEKGEYNINVPFLSKNDEFKVKIFTESLNSGENKPIVTLRSPEKFKRVDSKLNEKKVSKNNNSKGNHREKDKGSNKFIEVFEKIAGNKKAVAAILAALCLLFAVVLVKENTSKTSALNKKVYTNINKDKDSLNNGFKSKENNNSYKNNNNESTNNKYGNTVDKSNSSNSQSNYNKSEDNNETLDSSESSSTSKENSTSGNNSSNSNENNSNGESTNSGSGESSSNNNDNSSSSENSSSSLNSSSTEDSNNLSENNN